MEDKIKTTPKYKDRVIRVFISSTFCDMHAERDELVLRIFPQLRKMCKKRGVDFKEVDLRWGITEEQSKRGEVLPVCLAEIERCRPYFICHLGERYGDVAKTIDEDLVKDHPWLEKHKEKSYTDLEIVHGVLENPEMKRRAFFYFRNSAVSKEVEKKLEKESGYIKEPESYKAKLDTLKDEICKSGYPRKDYSDARTFGELVLKDLWAAIDERFPEGSQPTRLERERMDNEAFAEMRRKVYIGRDEYYSTLDDHVTGEGDPLVITGESGIGKSALISNWMEMYRKKRPDDFMIARFIGGTAESADYAFLLRSIMMEIKDRYEPETEGEKKEDHTAIIGEKEDEIPTDPKKVVEAFPLWLAKVAAREVNKRMRFILILAGLNQLTDRDNGLDRGWIPDFIPNT